MKTNNFKGVLLAVWLVLFTLMAQAQQGVVRGVVRDEKNQSLPGASVSIIGTTKVVGTKDDGTYEITGMAAGNYTVEVSFIGYQKQSKQVPIGNEPAVLDFTLQPDAQSLAEVVVIGYGTQQKKDLTGAITTVSSKDFNKGPVTTPDQLIQGKAAGVQITTNGGAPGAGSTIRVRGGASLNASNDPLIVIDGVPVDNTGISGSPNPLSLVNPNDVESMNILKDASATAIYGSRASNGVIIITTKQGQGGGRLAMNLNTTHSLQTTTGKIDVLSADEFRSVVTEFGTPTYRALLGDSNTDWQDQIYRTAYQTDNNLSLSGGINRLPYRLSLGYTNQDGILKTSGMQRYSGALNLNPKFFDDHLSVKMNLKGTITKSRFADEGAIGAAVAFDPTKPVYEESEVADLGGYFEWRNNNGLPNNNASRNPLSMLEQRDDRGEARRSIGNLELDYKFHFLPELRANVNAGYDVSEGKGHVINPATLASAYYDMGTSSEYSQKKNNKLLDFYLNYVKEFEAIKSRVDVTAGYSYQDFVRDEPVYPTYYGNREPVVNGVPFKTQNTLVSYFGRANYVFNDKYLLTGTIRWDGSSRFSPEARWGVFPSAAFAWRISEESFLKEVSAVSDLKLRLGYGITGQQDIGEDYHYLPRYANSDASALYPLGNNYYYTLRPNGYDRNLQWEQTATSNVGLDYGFLGGRINGTIDYYYKKTDNLLSTVPVAAGSNLTDLLLTNVGNMETKGFEFAINAIPVQTEDFTWNLSFNLTHNAMEITNLSNTNDPNQIIRTGSISGGTGTNIQVHAVGYTPFSFYVYQQLYDDAGRPMEGQYADLDENGVVNEQDLYRYKSPNPDVLMGLSSTFNYKDWSLGFTLRSSIGNYAYNNMASNFGSFQNFALNNYLNNLSSSALDTEFRTAQYLSDYYVEDASFVRMDNINLGYNLGNAIRGLSNVSINATVQNVFVISGYSGLDPEIFNGIDNNFYPRPRTYSLGLNVQF